MKDKIELALAKSLDKVEDGRIKEAMLYSLTAGGKRVRPLLFLKAANGYGLKEDEIMNVAVAIEYVHTYSLIHDDLPAMDNDDYRRGQLTCHKKFDEATAILAGDALLTEAFHLIGDTCFSSDVKIKLVMLLSEYSGIRGMIKGQELDIYNTTNDNIKLMDELKTGCLISLPMIMAAVIAGRTYEIEGWEQIGKKFGLLFQIQDDILDVTSNLEELGKMAYSDEKNQKVTYVKIYGLEECKAIVERTYQEIDGMRKLFTVPHNEVFDYLHSLNNRRK